MAENEVARAVLTIVPSLEGAQQEITSQLTSAASSSGVSDAGQTAGSTFSSGLKKGMVAAGAATAAVGAAAVGAGKAFVDAAGNVAAYGDDIDKMSQKMGISAEAYQEWDFIAQHSGTSMSSLKTSFKTLANAAQDGKEGFTQLGISLEDAASMSTEDLFAAVITGLQGMEEGTERTAIASELLGKGATELGALMNTSAEDTEAMRQQVHDLGGVMSEDAVKGAAAFQDSLQNMQTSFTGLLNGMMSEFLPGITSVMDGITAIASGDSEGGLAMISEGIQGLIDQISEAAPQLFEVAGSLLSSLAQAIMDNLPTLLDAAVPIVLEIANGIIEHLPELFQTGLQILLSIVDSISQNLPTLIPAAIETILAIVTALIENVDLLIDGAVQLMVGLATGLVEALPILVEKAPEIILSLLVALIEAAPKLLEAGVKIIGILIEGIGSVLSDLLNYGDEIIGDLKESIVNKVSEFLEVGQNIIEGIKDGIRGAWDNMVEWFSGLFDNLIGIAKRILGIASPSKAFRDKIGQWIPKGIAVGIEANADDVYDSVDDLVANTLVTPSVESLNAVASGFGLSSGSIANISQGNNLATLERLLMEYLPEIASNKGVTVKELYTGLNRQLGAALS